MKDTTHEDHMNKPIGVGYIRPDALYATGHVGRLLSVSKPTVRAYIRAGHLVGERVNGDGPYLVTGASVLAYLERHGLLPDLSTESTPSPTSGRDLMKRLERKEKQRKAKRKAGAKC